MKVMYRPLGEIVTFFGGGTPSKSRPEFYEGGSIPWITPKDMKSWIIDSSIDRITSEAMDQSTAKLIPAPGVLVVVRSGVLKHTLPVGINQVPVTVNQDMKALVCSNLVDPLYLGRFLRASAQSILTNVRGTTADNISTRVLKDLVVPLPPLAEQKRIAGILDAADALRAKRRESLAQLDTLLQSTFLDMFGDPVTNPMGWKVVTLGDVLSVKGGYAFKSADYLEDRFGVPLIRIGDVNRCEFVRQKLAQLPADYLDKFEKFVVRNGSILMSLTGTVGKDDYGNAVTLQGDTDRYLLNQRVAELIPRASLAADYLHGVLSHERVKRILTGRSRGIRQANISNNDIKQLQVQLPPLYLQRRFTTIVKSVEQQKSRLHTHLVELDTLFASLQQRAFDGELSA